MLINFIKKMDFDYIAYNPGFSHAWRIVHISYTQNKGKKSGKDTFFVIAQLLISDDVYIKTKVP